MMAFHIWYTLLHSFWIDFLWNSFLWMIVWKSSAFTFLLLAGLSFSLAEKKYWNKIIKKYLIYSLKIAFFALVISLWSYILFPHMYIRFGILHYFACAFLLLLVFRYLWYYNLVIACTIISISYFISPLTDTNLWLPFWFVRADFNSLDYYPLIPYFGYTLFGYVSGLFLWERSLMNSFSLSLRPAWISPILWMWKNSLLVYVVHLPFVYIIPYLFFLVFWLL